MIEQHNRLFWKFVPYDDLDTGALYSQLIKIFRPDKRARWAQFKRYRTVRENLKSNFKCLRSIAKGFDPTKTQDAVDGKTCGRCDDVRDDCVQIKTEEGTILTRIVEWDPKWPGLDLHLKK
jgi:hypothetical protein